MSQRTEYENASEYEDLLDDDAVATEGGSAGEGPTSGERATSRGLSVGRSALVTLAVTALAMVAFGSLLPFGTIAGLLGVAVAGFGLGVAGERSRYLELAASGALVAGVATFVDFLALSVFGVGLPLVAVGAVAGAVAAAGGHYAGRDVRDGLTREL